MSLTCCTVCGATSRHHTLSAIQSSRSGGLRVCCKIFVFQKKKKLRWRSSLAWHLSCSIIDRTTERKKKGSRSFAIRRFRSCVHDPMSHCMQCSRHCTAHGEASIILPRYPLSIHISFSSLMVFTFTCFIKLSMVW